MASYNKITIIGNLGRDAALRYTPQGTAVSEFSVATTEKYKDNETTTWFRVTLWGERAEKLNEYLTKGKQVYIEGKVSQSEWTDKEGNKRQTLEVKASELQLLGGRADSSEDRAEAAAAAPASKPQKPQGKIAVHKPATAVNDFDDSDIPF